MDELDAKMEKALEIQAKRLEILTKIARRNKAAFIKHIQKVLDSVTRNEYRTYVRAVQVVANSLDDEDWKKHSKNLKYSRNGAYVYLRLKLSDREYFTIAEAAGIDKNIITAMISQRAMQLYPPHKAVTDPIPKDLTNIKTVPADTHKVPNDRDTLKFFEQEDKHVQAGKMKVIENPRAKKPDQTYSIISFGKQGGGTIEHKLNGFNKAMLTALYSFGKAGNTVTSLDMMFAHMNGKEGRMQPTAKMREKMLKGIREMATTWVAIEFDVAGKLNYPKAKNKYEGNLIEVQIKTTIINGKPTKDAIIIKGFNPFVELAEAKDQILSYPKKLLYIPEVACTEETIIIKEELLRRIELMKKHGQTRIIIFDEAFKGIGYANMDKRQKRIVRDKANRMMEHWRKAGYIFRYVTLKQGQTPVKYEVFPNQPKPADHS